MKINFSFYFLLFIFSFNSFNLSYIVIPFKTNNKEEEINKKSEFNITKFYENNFRSQIYASINIGTPQKIIPINLLMNSQGLIIGYLCNINSKIEESKYDINTSSSFYSDPNNRKIYYNYYKDSFIGQDSFSFYTDIKMNSEKEIKLNNISFIYVPKEKINLNNNIICGNLGLSLKAYYYLTDEVNFIKNLKKLNYINKYDFSFYFTSDTKGLLIIGEEPHDYFPNIYNINNLRKTNALSDGYDNLSWKTEFAQIYFYSNDVKNKIKEKNAYFAIENNYIIGTKYYKKIIEEKFFKKYLDNNICYYESIPKEKYSILICEKTSVFDIGTFPTLYFYHRIFNYTFELTKENLFIEKNNKYIFLIFFSENQNYFTLGKLFLRKYLFVFNIDSKSIGFYNYYLEFNEKKLNSISLIYKLIGALIILIACIVGFYLAKKIYEQTRKRRLNEIIEQYEYKSHDVDDINYDDNNDNKNIMVEIPLKS